MDNSLYESSWVRVRGEGTEGGIMLQVCEITSKQGVKVEKGSCKSLEESLSRERKHCSGWEGRILQSLTLSVPQLWDAQSGSLLQKLQADMPVLDICPMEVNQAHLLAALTEKLVKIYKWQ